MRRLGDRLYLAWGPLRLGSSFLEGGGGKRFRGGFEEVEGKEGRDEGTKQSGTGKRGGEMYYLE